MTGERFDGKVALVTGGSRGIGAATARRLADRGALVGVGGRDEAAIAAVVDDVRSRGGVAVGLPADTTDAAALEGAVHRLGEELGPVELLAAFAGGNGRPTPTEELSPEEWRRVVDGDLTSSFLTVHAVLPTMLEHGRGSIVTMSSSAGRQPSRANAAYAAAKAAVVGLTKHLAAELAGRGVRVNCVAPQAVVNERMLANTDDDQREAMARGVPLGRLGEPDDVAAAATHLLSDDAAFLTGVTLDVTGGAVIV